MGEKILLWWSIWGTFQNIAVSAQDVAIKAQGIITSWATKIKEFVGLSASEIWRDVWYGDTMLF